MENNWTRKKQDSSYSCLLRSVTRFFQGCNSAVFYMYFKGKYENKKKTFYNTDCSQSQASRPCSHSTRTVGGMRAIILNTGILHGTAPKNISTVSWHLNQILPRFILHSSLHTVSQFTVFLRSCRHKGLIECLQDYCKVFSSHCHLSKCVPFRTQNSLLSSPALTHEFRFH